MSTNLDLYKYRVYCSTENAFKYWWLDETQTVPTTCPDDSGHTVDTSRTLVVDTRESNVVNIAQENVKTGENYRYHTIQFDALGNQTTQYTFSFPFNVSVMDAMIQVAEENTGDRMSWRIMPDTIIGALTQNANVDDNTFHVSPTVTSNLKVGFKMNLTNGVETRELGFVTAIDAENGTVTTENSLNYSFLASAPTYVVMNIYFLDSIEFGHPGRLLIGDSKIKSSYLPANTTVLCEYENKTANTKRIVCNVEIMY